MLFDEIRLKDLTLKNRIAMAPMCVYSAGADGKVTDWHLLHYGTRAVGGVGLLVLEATAVSPEGRISSNDLGLWCDEQVDGMSRLVETVHALGGKVGVQLAHAGRKCTADVPLIYAPSAIAYDAESRVPVAMAQEDIEKVAGDFREAARRALQAGFDLVQIHAAHGYLINEFLSPLTNRREDGYGGDYSGRGRILAEVVHAVKDAWPGGKPLEVRVTAEDYGEGGNTVVDVIEMLKPIIPAGIDSVNVSTGGVIPVVPKAVPGYQIPAAAAIKDALGIPTVAGGLVTEASEADGYLTQGKADMIYMGRELLRNPYWPLAAAKALGVEIPWPTQYERARR
ncbi:MAG: NADPH dehydrogenase NamA [Clostridiales Family XIII bacterium]|jgi:NADPH2 dehydrogenase|nr:NADPH dehydrogenase NamA [Clostridiales Family XIII bacterium]